MQGGARWGAGTPEVRDSGQGDSLNMIPAWAVLLSVVIFAGSMFFFNYTPSRPTTPPVPQTTASQQDAVANGSATGTDATASTTAPATTAQNGSSPATTPQAHRTYHTPPTPAQKAGHLMFSYTTSAALASYVLLIGYVTRDVKRRHMSAPLWTLIVLVMPGGIGAIVYFMLRQPLMTRCPHCTTELTEGVHFCPQCRFQVAPVCGQCFRGVQITDAFCPQCGHDTAEDAAPARLRAYSDS
jgi:hypothetical protein